MGRVQVNRVQVNHERGGKASVYRISGARKGLTEDVRARQRRYVISMSVRTLCFLLAVVFTGPLRWAMLAGALLLPYVAVVIANAGREPNSDPPPALSVPPQPHKAIEAPPEAVLTSAERHDIRVVPDDAWIVSDDPAHTSYEAPSTPSPEADAAGEPPADAPLGGQAWRRPGEGVFAASADGRVAAPGEAPETAPPGPDGPSESNRE